MPQGNIAATVNVAVLSNAQQALPKQIIAGVNAAQKAVNSQPIKFNFDTRSLIQARRQLQFPLGQISKDAGEFEKSMKAATGRVVAFGAAVGSLYAIQRAMGALVTTSIEVEQKLKEIQVISNGSAKDFQTFTKGIFEVGRQTSTSFKEASDAALEFARQGLTLSEQLKRTRDAMTLVKVSGVDVGKAVESITASLNTFNVELKDSTDLVDRLTSVDNAFAVSASDLAEGLSRVGNASQEAGVSLNETLGAITALQQRTARGGAVIGNALKSIFTRIGREDNVELLNNLGIATETVSGKTRDAIDVLKDLAQVYKGLDDSQKKQISTQIAGLYQINQFQALIKDLGSSYSFLDQATQKAADSQGSAARRIDELNKTIAARITQTGTNLTELASQIGKLSFENPLKGFLETFGANDSILSDFNKLLGQIGTDSESSGATIANGILKGIGNFISGPGLVFLTKLIAPILKTIGGFIGDIFKQNLFVSQSMKEQVTLQGQINNALLIASEEDRNRINNAATLNKQLELTLQLLRAQQQIVITPMTLGLQKAGVKAGAISPIVPVNAKIKASGYSPIKEELSAIQSSPDYIGNRNAQPRILKDFSINGKRQNVVINSAEKVVPTRAIYRGYTGPDNYSILNPRQQRDMGFNDGYIPNLAIDSSVYRHYYKQLKRRLRSGKAISDLSGYGFWDKMGKYNESTTLYRGTKRKEIEEILKSGKFTSQWVDGLSKQQGNWVTASLNTAGGYANRTGRSLFMQDDDLLNAGQPYVMALRKDLAGKNMERRIATSQGDSASNMGISGSLLDSDIRAILKVDTTATKEKKVLKALGLGELEGIKSAPSAIFKGNLLFGGYIPNLAKNKDKSFYINRGISSGLDAASLEILSQTPSRDLTIDFIKKLKREQKAFGIAGENPDTLARQIAYDDLKATTYRNRKMEPFDSFFSDMSGMGAEETSAAIKLVKNSRFAGMSDADKLGASASSRSIFKMFPHKQRTLANLKDIIGDESSRLKSFSQLRSAFKTTGNLDISGFEGVAKILASSRKGQSLLAGRGVTSISGDNGLLKRAKLSDGAIRELYFGKGHQTKDIIRSLTNHGLLNVTDGKANLYSNDTFSRISLQKNQLKNLKAFFGRRGLLTNFASGKIPGLKEAINREANFVPKSSIYIDHVNTPNYSGPVVANNRDEPNRISLEKAAYKRLSTGFIPNLAKIPIGLSDVSSIKSKKDAYELLARLRMETSAIPEDFSLKAFNKQDTEAAKRTLRKFVSRYIGSEISSSRGVNIGPSKYNDQSAGDSNSGSGGSINTRYSSSRFKTALSPAAKELQQRREDEMLQNRKSLKKYGKQKAEEMYQQAQIEKRRTRESRENLINDKKLIKEDEKLKAERIATQERLLRIQKAKAFGQQRIEKLSSIEKLLEKESIKPSLFFEKKLTEQYKNFSPDDIRVVRRKFGERINIARSASISRRTQLAGTGALLGGIGLPLAAGMVDASSIGKTTGGRFASSILQGAGVGASVGGFFGLPGLAAGTAIGATGGAISALKNEKSEQRKNDLEKKLLKLDDKNAQLGIGSQIIQNKARISDLVASGASDNIIQANIQQLASLHSQIKDKNISNIFQDTGLSPEKEQERMLIDSAKEEEKINANKEYFQRKASMQEAMDAATSERINVNTQSGMGGSVGGLGLTDLKDTKLTKVTQEKIDKARADFVSNAARKIDFGVSAKTYQNAEGAKNKEQFFSILRKGFSGTDDQFQKKREKIEKDYLSEIKDEAEIEKFLKELAAKEKLTQLDIDKVKKEQLENLKQTVKYEKVKFDITQRIATQELNNFRSSEEEKRGIASAKSKLGLQSAFLSEEKKGSAESKISVSEILSASKTSRQDAILGTFSDLASKFPEMAKLTEKSKDFTDAVDKLTTLKNPKDIADSIDSLISRIPIKSDSQIKEQAQVNALKELKTNLMHQLEKINETEKTSLIAVKEQQKTLVDMLEQQRQISAMGGAGAIGKGNPLQGIGGLLRGAQASNKIQDVGSLTGLIGSKAVTKRRENLAIEAASNKYQLAKQLQESGMSIDGITSSLGIKFFDQIKSGRATDIKRNLTQSSKELGYSFLSGSKIGQYNPSLTKKISESKSTGDVISVLSKLQPSDKKDSLYLKDTIASLKILKEQEDKAAEIAKTQIDAEFKLGEAMITQLSATEKNTEAIIALTEKLNISPTKDESSSASPTIPSSNIISPEVITTPTVSATGESVDQLNNIINNSDLKPYKLPKDVIGSEDGFDFSRFADGSNVPYTGLYSPKAISLGFKGYKGASFYQNIANGKSLDYTGVNPSYLTKIFRAKDAVDKSVSDYGQTYPEDSLMTTPLILKRSKSKTREAEIDKARRLGLGEEISYTRPSSISPESYMSPAELRPIAASQIKNTESLNKQSDSASSSMQNINAPIDISVSVSGSSGQELSDIQSRLDEFKKAVQESVMSLSKKILIIGDNAKISFPPQKMSINNSDQTPKQQGTSMANGALPTL